MGLIKASKLSFLSLSITELSPINGARCSAKPINYLLLYEDTIRNLQRTSIKIALDKFISIKEAMLSATNCLQWRGYSNLSYPTSHVNKEEGRSIWWFSIPCSNDMRCVPKCYWVRLAVGLNVIGSWQQDLIALDPTG